MSILVSEHASQRSTLISRNCLSCPIGAHLIWTSPVYKFIVPDKTDDAGLKFYNEIWMDVTDSVPPFDSPKATLGSVLDQSLKFIPENGMILDFGAGKLRNAIYLLEKGYQVRAVEFEKTQGMSKQSRDMYERAFTYKGQFDKLVFPHEFFKSKIKFANC